MAAIQRISSPKLTAALLAGDAAAFLAFAAIGRRSHGEAAGLAALLEVAGTAAPFLIAWLAIAPWLGAYRGAPASPVAALRVAALAWLLALPLGAVLRALAIGRLSPPSFYIVTFLAVLAILGGWRAAFAWLVGRRG
jgi:hypothetical protein